MAKHIHLHFKDDLHVHPNFKEEQHPRSHGKFAKKGTGGSGSAPKLTLQGKPGKRTPRVYHAPQPKKSLGQRAKQAVAATGAGVKQFGKQFAQEFGREDAELLQQGIHKPGSEARKSVASKISQFAKNLPQFIKTHAKEEKVKFVGASRALRAMASGKKPTPEDSYNLKKAGLSIALTAVSAALHDPTGATAHGAVAAVNVMGALVQEFVQHTMYEHGAAGAAGGIRFGYGKLTGKPVHVHVHDTSEDIDYVLLQQFIERLAKVVETKDIPETRIRELLAQRSKPGMH